LPTGTIHTPLRLLADVFPAIFALDLLLDNVIIAEPAIRARNHPKTDCDQQEPDDLVDEVAIGKHDCAVI
jgi:hypothetical protein